MKNKTIKKDKDLENIKEDLQQEDYYDSDYIEKVSEKYSKLIGIFIIKFNELEHELNRAIAKTFIDDDDSVGYRVIKLLNVSNKIELFYEIFLEITTSTDGKVEKLKKIKKKLDEARIFRNKLVHANWSTLTKEGYVRTKIESNKENGAIQLVKVKILPKTIKGFIDKVESLIIKIWEYSE